MGECFLRFRGSYFFVELYFAEFYVLVEWMASPRVSSYPISRGKLPRQSELYFLLLDYMVRFDTMACWLKL